MKTVYLQRIVPRAKRNLVEDEADDKTTY